MTMSADEMKVLKANLSQATHYFEYGSGNSTILACQCPAIERIKSVESSEAYINDVLLKNQDVVRAHDNGRLMIQHIDIGETLEWGYPSTDASKPLWPNYADAITHETVAYDLVLVDGRFRIACIVNVLTSLSSHCTVLVHDFWNRNFYHQVLNLVDVVDSVGTLAVLKRRKDFDTVRAIDLLARYRYDPK